MKLSAPASLRNGLLAATWLAGTLLATGAVYAAVSAVGDQVTDQGPAPISQADLQHALNQEGRPSASPSAPATPGASPSPAAPSPTPTGDGNHPPSPSSRPATSNRTFALIGGTANVGCSGSQVALNWATPSPGFEVETGSSDGGAQVEVRFRSDGHESRLEASCSTGGQVQAGTQEESR